MDGYRHFASVARGMGVEVEVIDADECARRHPLITIDGLTGGLWDPHDGHIDPAQLCAALARRARRAGAEIYRDTPVTGLSQRTDGGWTVDTPGGSLDCEVVVNAGGYRCNEIGAMMGVRHPVISMEHQYFVTGPIQRIIDADRRMPLLRCPVSDYYCRQERQGLLVGFYERDCRTWGMDGIDPNFSKALCPEDLDRVGDVLEGAVARMPVLAETGVHTSVNGPITYTPDGAPLVGPVPGRRDAYCIIGLRAGLGEGGGHGWLLAQRIVHGEAVYDTWCLDPRRFTGHGNTELTARKAVEEYRNEFDKRFETLFGYVLRPRGRKKGESVGPPTKETVESRKKERTPPDGRKLLLACIEFPEIAESGADTLSEMPFRTLDNLRDAIIGACSLGDRLSADDLRQFLVRRGYDSQLKSLNTDRQAMRADLGGEKSTAESRLEAWNQLSASYMERFGQDSRDQSEERTRMADFIEKGDSKALNRQIDALRQSQKR